MTDVMITSGILIIRLIKLCSADVVQTDLTVRSLAPTDKPEQPRDRTRTKHKPMKPTKWPYETTIQNTPKPSLRERTHRAWFSRLLRHPIRKWSGSLFLQPGARTGQLNTDD